MASGRPKLKVALAVTAAALACYGLIAYIALPLAWTH